MKPAPARPAFFLSFSLSVVPLSTSSLSPLDRLRMNPLSLFTQAMHEPSLSLHKIFFPSLST
ncbi:hypothetical protein AMTRI_Chr13g89620 [Amborella trichopoda]